MSRQVDGHPTVAIRVWVDVDAGIADLVLRLNEIPGVRTLASCQGTLGEGGSEPYGPYVMARWEPDALPRLTPDFDIEFLGECWGYLHPRQGTRKTAPPL